MVALRSERLASVTLRGRRGTLWRGERAGAGDLPHSYLPTGEVVWLDGALALDAELDAELRARSVPERLARYIGQPPDAFWERWTYCEVVAKLYNIPMPILLRSGVLNVGPLAPLDAIVVTVGDLTVCVGLMSEDSPLEPLKS